MSTYSESELILNPDGSIFHLRLLPEQISDQIIMVGDPGRVTLIGSFLERVENLASNREFISLSGYFNNKKITVISSGIGTDNVDIVLNELDILANVNLETREDNPVKRSLSLVRIGTSGSIQPDLPAGSTVASAWAIGLDCLLKYYRRGSDPEREAFEKAFLKSTDWPDQLPEPYAAKASERLLKKVGSFSTPGITVSAHGFYGPQGRELRGKLAVPDLNSRLLNFSYGTLRTTNFEMETSALYGLSGLLGHEALTVCTIIADRTAKSFTGSYETLMNNLIYNTLNGITDRSIVD
ncbi:MAG: nucleoside phosphorylase [Bacteroidales bacterium]|nr:nucleoside phosphorylase [Bacteroidales bacterium]